MRCHPPRAYNPARFKPDASSSPLRGTAARLSSWRRKENPEEERSVRAEQTVSEMAVESLARQAEAITDQTDRPFEEAFAEVLKTPAGRKLAELADGPHRHEKAAD